MLTWTLPRLPSECPFKHCYVCGQHHNASGLYCHDCLENRYTLVKRDAEIRGIAGDIRDHRFWMIDHPEKKKEDDAD